MLHERQPRRFCSSNSKLTGATNASSSNHSHPRTMRNPAQVSVKVFSRNQRSPRPVSTSTVHGMTATALSLAGTNLRPASVTVQPARKSFTSGCSERPKTENIALTAKIGRARSRASRNGNRWESRNASASAVWCRSKNYTTKTGNVVPLDAVFQQNYTALIWERDTVSVKSVTCCLKCLGMCVH